MVFSSEEENMATGKPPLHNFMLPHLKWGTQRHLKCVKDPSDDGSPSESSPKNVKKKITKERINGGDDDGIGAVREKLMLDLKTEADKMKAKILKKNGGAAEAGEKTWNLRTRRGGENGKGLKIGEKKLNNSPARNVNGGAEKKVMKFSLTLTKEEIEEDFIKMTGHRPPRRPKRRSKNVQKQLDTLFPGMWLSEINADSYKVDEVPEKNGKKH